jgi:hypothetical protein
MAILAEAARHLGWTWAEENVWYDPWEIWEKIRINTERKSPGDFFRRGAREGLPTLSNQVENFRATLAWIRTNFLDDASTFKAILIWWAVAGRRDLIRGIEAVSDGIGKRFNFYPPLARKKMPGQNRRDLMRRIIRATDQYCWTQAERMVYGCEVVMDCPPKIIAAAATLPICCQPYFPTGRILMSVRYTDGGWDPYLRYLKGSFAREPEVWETVRRNLQEYWTPSRVSRGNSATPRRKQNNASKSR